MPESVKCADCGFLSMVHVESGELVAADLSFRNKGNILLIKGRDERYVFAPYPVCAAKTTHLVDLMSTSKDNEPQPRKGAMQAERQCDAYTPWLPGLSPKDHREMIQEEARLRWQAEREQEDRRWRESESRSAASRHRWDLVLIGILVPLAAMLTTIAAAFIERGDWFAPKATHSVTDQPAKLPNP